MKKRLPRKIKKAMLTAHLSLDKKFGYKMKKSALKRHMHLLYLEQLYGKKISYISQPLIGNCESIQGTYKGQKILPQYACILLYQERARTLASACKRENAKIC